MMKILAVLQLICGLVQLVLWLRYRRAVKAVLRAAQSQPESFRGGE